MDIVDIVRKELDDAATPEELTFLRKWREKATVNEIEYQDLKLLMEGGPGKDEKSSSEFLHALEQIKIKIAERTIRKRKIEGRKYLIFSLIAPLLVIISFLVTRYPGQEKKSVRFNSAPLSNVIEFIQKTYGIEIEVDSNDILACHFTGVIYGMHPPHEIAANIAQGTNLRLEKMGPTRYRFKGPGCR